MQINMHGMKGFAQKTIVMLTGAVILYMPAAPAFAFRPERHDEGLLIIRDQSRGQSLFDDDREGRGMLPPMSQDRARRAMQQGEILPLSNIRRRIRDQFGGKIIGVDLAQSGEDSLRPAPWVYDIRVLSPEGRVFSVLMDASDGRVLGVRGQR